MAREWCSKQAGFDLIDELDSVERHVSLWRGSENAMRDLYRAPESLRKLCDIALSSLIVYAVAIISSGVDILFISDPSSSGDVISKKHCHCVNA